jgi:hypothetical protein
VKSYRQPQTPEEMLAQLQVIFPTFDHEWDEDEWPGMSRTCHGVVRDLADYFPSNVAALTEQQVIEFAYWLNGSVEAGGDVENAVSTCFLEHSRQIGVFELLAPHLTPLARSRTHA